MAILYFPVKGYHKGLPASIQPQGTSPDLNNVRPRAGGRYQGGQRPGLTKTFNQQIGGAAKPVVAICSVVVVA